MHDPYAYLNEHEECTSPSGSVMETSYASSDEGGGSPWSGISSLARNFAQTINKSAKSIMNELAELEYEARARSDGGASTGSYDNDSDASETGADTNMITNTEHHPHHNHRRNHRRHNNKQNQPTKTILPLPWEICLQQTDENLKISIVQKEDEPLKEKMMALSKDESVFTGPFNEKNSYENENDDALSIFTLDDSRVMLIRRLLEIDSNLGYIHARVSGRSAMKEKIFWMNYFFHCEKLRENREKEINDESLRLALHDDELDAELVGRPPASCTGFYPRTGKLSLHETSSDDNNDDDYEENRFVPALALHVSVPVLESCTSTDDFVMVDESDMVEGI